MDEDVQLELKKIKEDIEDLKRKKVHQSDVPTGVLKQRHMELGAMLIFRGDAADRPDGTGEVKAYFADDTQTLSIYSDDEGAWVDFPRIPSSLADYTVSNLSTDRSYDADSTTTAELADVLGTLLADLASIGIIE